MGITITGVGRRDDLNVLEVESDEAWTVYGYDDGDVGIKGDFIGCATLEVSAEASNITIGGVKVKLTRLDDRTIVQLGDQDPEHHIFSSSKIEWSSTMSILADLKRAPDFTAYAKRQTGKTTALCIRAAEFRIEGLTVEIVCINPRMALITEGVLLDVIHELFPQSYSHMLEGIKCTTGRMRTNADRYLLDEPQLLEMQVRQGLPAVHGQVISLS